MSPKQSKRNSGDIQDSSCSVLFFCGMVGNLATLAQAANLALAPQDSVFGGRFMKLLTRTPPIHSDGTT